MNRTNTIAGRAETIVGELANLLNAIDPVALETMTREILKADRVFFTAQGRSGLMMKAVAIRMMHIGIPVYVAGETVTPSVRKGNLVVAVSASARTATTLSHLFVAKQAGAVTVLITCEPASETLADHVLLLPIRTDVETVQHAGSLFEQALLIIGDAIAFAVQSELNVGDEVLNNRHATLQ